MANAFPCQVLCQLYIPHSSDKTVERKKTKRKLISCLYIPHSSDKTKRYEKKYIDRKELYIPHSSDKTPVEGGHKRLFCDLYIPHSSDKTNWVVIEAVIPANVFTSHIVQIKPVET